jgi:hypothetical protein
MNLNINNFNQEYAEQQKFSAQKYLDYFYPQDGTCKLKDDTNNFGKQRKEITELNIRCKNLHGDLDLNDFINLEKLDCGDNQLTSLNLGQNQKLKSLRVARNHFSERDLSFLSHLVNLEALNLCVNRFIGSLESLKNMTKLELLDISGTDVSSGLEYLPESVKYFDCFSAGRVQGIYELFSNEQGKVEKEYESRYGIVY